MANSFEQIMQQAKLMQENIKKMQEELSSTTIVGEAGAGMVKITANGQGEVLQVSIDDSIYNEEKQILQGLIVVAINDIRKKRERMMNDKMKKYFGNLGLPSNFTFPFMPL